MSGLRVGSLFSGYGGLDLAVTQVLGGRVAWHCDVDPDARRVLRHRWPGVPLYEDVATMDWPTVEPVEVLTGGFPCQDLSAAGRRVGMRPGSRSGLWTHMAYAIAQLGPRYVVIENVKGLLNAQAHCDVEPCPWCLGDGRRSPLRALGAVLGDLAGLRYDAQWISVRAADVGAPHGRSRVFILATPADPGGPGREGEGSPAAGRAEPAAGDPRPCGAGAGDAPADPGRGGVQRRAEPGGLPGAEGPGAGEGLQRQRGRDAAGDGGPAPADDPRVERGRGAGLLPDRPAGGGRRRSPDDDGQAPPDDYGDGREGQSAGDGPQAGAEGAYGDDAHGRGMAPEWGEYGPAVRRWERVFGRAAPSPTIPGPRGGQRLNPVFAEWMMGLPLGHVTDVPGISRRAQLRLLGNGVVPQQAAAALRDLLDDAWRAA